MNCDRCGRAMTRLASYVALLTDEILCERADCKFARYRHGDFA